VEEIQSDLDAFWTVPKEGEKSLEGIVSANGSHPLMFVEPLDNQSYPATRLVAVVSYDYYASSTSRQVSQLRKITRAVQPYKRIPCPPWPVVLQEDNNSDQFASPSTVVSLESISN
jgi:hypothetical protein